MVEVAQFTIVDPDKNGIRLASRIGAPGAQEGDVMTVGADGYIATAPGGGGSVTTRGQYSGNPVTIADGDTGYLTWDSHNDGSALLDISDPAAPKPLVSGVYALSVSVGMADPPITSGGVGQVTLWSDEGLGWPAAYGDIVWGTVPLPLTYYIPAGTSILLTVRNLDGASAHAFAILSATVQQLSGPEA